MLRYLGSITCQPADSRNNTQGIRAELDPSFLGAGNFDTYLRAISGGEAGNEITLSLAGGAPGAVTIDIDGTAITINYKTLVSTVADVEAAITANVVALGAAALIEVKTPGTAITVLDAGTDDFDDEPLQGGEDDFFEIPATLSRLGLLTTANSQSVEVKPDADNPSDFTTDVASVRGVPLTANVLFEVALPKTSSPNVVAVYNSDNSTRTVRVYAMES